MMKMLISLDEERVLRDGKYPLANMWQKIDAQFEKCCKKEKQPDGSVVYAGEMQKDYYTQINLAAIYLKRQKWFAEYCNKWIWYDNEDDETLPYQEIDVLARQRRQNALFA